MDQNRPRKSRVRRAVLYAVTILFACLGACAVYVIVGCIMSKLPPKAPVYPGSVFERQASYDPESCFPIITYYYTSSSSPSQIIDYYERVGECSWGVRPDEKKICYGETDWWGRYYIYIDMTSYVSSGATSYAVEILVRRCECPW